MLRVIIVSPLGLGGFLGLVLLGAIALIAMKAGHAVESLAPGPNKADVAVHLAKEAAAAADTPQQAIRTIVRAYGVASTVGAECKLMTPNGRREIWDDRCGDGLGLGRQPLTVASITLLGNNRARVRARLNNWGPHVLTLRAFAGQWLVDSDVECEPRC